MTRSVRAGKWFVRCLAPTGTCPFGMQVCDDSKQARTLAFDHAYNTGHTMSVITMVYTTKEDDEQEGW